jgi:transcriptional regulator with XRE-family HTH domain
MPPPKYVTTPCSHCRQPHKRLNGAWLRYRRERAGVRLRELSRRSGISAAHISDVECGFRAVTARTQDAYALIGALEVK